MPTFKNEVTGPNEDAIVGISSGTKGTGVIGTSEDGDGVLGFSTSGNGVVGQADREAGVRGVSKAGRGVEGWSQSGDAMRGISDTGNAVVAQSHSGLAVAASSDTASAVRAVSKSGRGVEGWSESSYGVSGDSQSSAGVRGTSAQGRGVEGWSARSEGVVGISESGTGVWGVAGRSRMLGKSGTELVGGLIFEAAAAAKKYASQPKAPLPLPETHPNKNLDPRELAALTTSPASSPLLSHGHGHIQPPPAPSPFGPGELVSPAAEAGVTSVVDGALERYDDTAGIGVCGEHRGGGTGVKAVSNTGTGLTAYSNGFEAIHAETRSQKVAAIAAYNTNPNGTGAALYAKKEGSRGHAGFFDGRVWIGGELGVGGDILLANADCAEDFDVSSVALAEPGTVMVIGDDAVLHPCTAAYDRRVAGVISGAGQYKPGLILDKQPAGGERSPVALLGKVYCKVTAEHGAIAVGDLLTTSRLEGHAMKADPVRAPGAVLGKALRPLASGIGLIPILVALA
jgi:hypothetical protein